MPRAVGRGIGAGFVGAGGRVGRATPPGRKRSRTGTRRLPGIACALPAEHERTWLCSRPWRPASVTTNAGRADRPRRLPVGRLRPIPLSANVIVGLRPRFVDQECWRALPASASCHEAGPEDSPRQSPHYLHEAELRQVDRTCCVSVGFGRERRRALRQATQGGPQEGVDGALLWLPLETGAQPRAPSAACRIRT